MFHTKACGGRDTGCCHPFSVWAQAGDSGRVASADPPCGRARSWPPAPSWDLLFSQATVSHQACRNSVVSETYTSETPLNWDKITFERERGRARWNRSFWLRTQANDPGLCLPFPSCSPWELRLKKIGAPGANHLHKSPSLGQMLPLRMQPSEPCGPNWPKQGRSLSLLPTPLISAGSPEDLNFSSCFWDGGSLEKKGSFCPWGLASATGSLSHSGPAAGAWPHRFQAVSQCPALITPFLQGSHD